MGRRTDFLYIIVVIFLSILILKIFVGLYRTRRREVREVNEKRALWFQRFMTRLQDRFPDQTFRIDESHPFTIVTPPKHPVVGGLRISDDGNNIMVELGLFAHWHFFGKYIPGISYEERRESLVVNVLLFVEDVFENKVEVFGGPRGGGFRDRGKEPRGFLSKLFFGKTTYVWSGPIEER